MIHVLFGQSEAATLRHVLKEMNSNKDQILVLDDNFSVGPIREIHVEAGLTDRIDWLKNVRKDEFDVYNEFKQEYVKVINRIKSIPAEESILIWTSENASEQTGFRFVLFLLKERSNEIKVMNTTKVYGELFNQPKIQYVIKSSGEIAPEKFAILYEESKKYLPLNQQERKILEEEGKQILETSDTLRIWLEGKIKSVSEDYYDQYIIDTAKKLHNQQGTYEFIKCVRVIGDAIGYLEQYLGDGFLEYRVKKLVQKGVFEVKGSMKAMRFYSIKVKN